MLSRFIFNTLTIFVFSLILLFNNVFAETNIPFLGEINSDKINLRSDATASAKVIGTLNKGQRVDVVIELYDWYKIRLPKVLAVYVKDNLVSCINYSNPREPAQLPSVCLSAKVLKDRVNVRAGPGESYSIVGVADKNEIVNILGKESGWYKIEPIQNSFCWVHKRFVNKVTVPDKNLPVVNLAKEATQAPTDDNILLEGVVKPYGVVLMRKATHKLLTKDRKIYLLKGNRTSLNALTHQKVKVIGKVISPVEAKYPIVEVKIIEVVN